MISSQLGAGYALVPVPPDNNPNSGGGPIRKSPLLALPAHAGIHVHRTPHLVVREAEPGAAWPVDLSTTSMFIQDGRLVTQQPYARDMFRGALGSASCSSGVVKALVKGGAFFGGAAVGYTAASKHKVWGAIGGAAVGGILGAIFG